MSDATKSGEVVRKAIEVPLKDVPAGNLTKTQLLLGPGDGMPHFAMRRFVMGMGGGMPRHTNTVEHEQYVLSGKATIGIGDEEYEVGPGTVLYIPAGVPHFYKVQQSPFEFLCMVPNKPDKIEIVED